MNNRPYPHPRAASRRAHPGNLSKTRPPGVAADRALWPDWTHLPIERLGFRLAVEPAAAVFKQGGAR